MAGPGAVIVHDLAHARAAMAAAAALGAPLTLRSPPDAAGYLGAGAFNAILEAAAAEHPGVRVHGVLDCGDAPGLALGAVRIGIPAVRLRAPPDMLSKVADIAAQLGASLDCDERQALDLKDVRDHEGACRLWLGGV